MKFLVILTSIRDKSYKGEDVVCLSIPIGASIENRSGNALGKKHYGYVKKIILF